MLIIDRFEGEIAIIELEKGKFVQIPRIILPSEAREGDVITVQIDQKRTADRRSKIEGLLHELWED
jgi:hypothetical protein